ncbi:MAG: ABC-F family ATP-binding cassette domain-containing protein [Dehalococcoidia bacterium]|nr:ABC-F family ATP-binding cassette domain-containing protein [Dehalococcoidia bacterium]
MLTLTDISVRFGGQLLYEDVNWQLSPRGHYGLVGANGSGKSTLLRVMTGELAPTTGSVSQIRGLNIGTLGQDHFRFDDRTPIDVVRMGRPRLWQALEERAGLLLEVVEGGAAQQGERLAEIEAEIGGLGGYQSEAEAAALLVGLGVPHERHERPMRELSGGFRLRVLLAQTLFFAPDLLLLDEPTNHLDIASIRWLEGYLREFRGAFVVISHDRHFLNAICDQIADVDYQEVRLYAGNYDAFEAAKTLASTQKEAELVRAEARREELQEFIDRFRAKATKARQASARKKQVAKMELPELKRSSRKSPAFRFTPRRPSGREVLDVRGVSKRFGDGPPVLRDVSFAVERGQRVAVVGPNGVGKSTLLNIVRGALEADSGSVRFGHEVQTGYFAQDHHELLRGEASAYDWLCSATGLADIPTVRGTLGAVLLSGDDALKRVNDLSGGEAARLLLGALMLQQPNLLLLDEPTNHLDLEGREGLMRALQAYTGTVLFVSHDRHFVSGVGTRVLALSPDGLEDFAGTYEEYLAKQGADFLAGAQGAAEAARSSGPPTAVAAGDYAERKERRRNLALLKRSVERLEHEAGELERAIADLETVFADPGYYQRTEREQLQADVERQEGLRQRLAATVAEWEESALALDAIEVEA